MDEWVLLAMKFKVCETVDITFKFQCHKFLFFLFFWLYDFFLLLYRFLKGFFFILSDSVEGILTNLELVLIESIEFNV